MSIVAVHSGEIAKPRKNTVTLKPDTPITMSWKRITGTSPATAKTQLPAIISERAICRLPVRRSRESVVIPPELGHIRATDQDGASRAKARDDRRVALRRRSIVENLRSGQGALVRYV